MANENVTPSRPMGSLINLMILLLGCVCTFQFFEDIWFGLDGRPVIAHIVREQSNSSRHTYFEVVIDREGEQVRGILDVPHSPFSPHLKVDDEVQVLVLPNSDEPRLASSFGFFGWLWTSLSFAFGVALITISIRSFRGNNPLNEKSESNSKAHSASEGDDGDNNAEMAPQPQVAGERESNHLSQNSRWGLTIAIVALILAFLSLFMLRIIAVSLLLSVWGLHTIWFAFSAVKTGEFKTEKRFITITGSRDKSPASFWLGIALYGSLGLALVAVSMFIPYFVLVRPHLLR